MTKTSIDLAKTVLTWYDDNRRDLPWRQEPIDPYKTWVSEIMLQQTRVEAVIPLFHRFIQAFPSVQGLATASLDSILVLWQGLGYYSRARRLYAAAQVIVTDLRGSLPATATELQRLPGIGPYTAAAIASIAFNEPCIALDGNLLRVGSRLFNNHGDITRTTTKNEIKDSYELWLPKDRPGDFNQALMDLGAGTCLPRQPRCGECPLESGCQARSAELHYLLPTKPKRREPTQVQVHVLDIQTDTHILLRQRSHGGFLQGMWEMPWFAQEPSPATTEGLVVAEMKANAQQHLCSALQLSLPTTIRQTDYKFSHRHWHMSVFSYHLTARQIPDSITLEADTIYRWHRKDRLEDAALPSVFEQLLPPDLRTRGK